MTIDPSKLAGIPKMTPGQALNAAQELDKLCTPVVPSKIPTTAHLGDPCIYCKTTHDEVAPGPCPGATAAVAPVARVVQPDPAFYWADDYGNIWRQAVEPIVILSVTSGCTVAELGIVLAALLGSR